MHSIKTIPVLPLQRQGVQKTDLPVTKGESIAENFIIIAAAWLNRDRQHENKNLRLYTGKKNQKSLCIAGFHIIIFCERAVPFKIIL